MADLPHITLSDAMRRECERKGVTDPETIENIARFETFLRHAGPVAPISLAAEGGDEAVRSWYAEHLTDEQRTFRKAMFADPVWRAWFFGEDDPSPAACDGDCPEYGCQPPSTTQGNVETGADCNHTWHRSRFDNGTICLRCGTRQSAEDVAHD